MINTKPFFSIVTINLNNAAGLAKTLDSVLAQGFQDFEMIVIDGNSTDSSKDEILKRESGIRRWVSEPDNGIYNAMNKGIGLAQGEFIQFLNSGDSLVDSSILENVRRHASSRDVDILYGETVRCHADRSDRKIMPDKLRSGLSPYRLFSDNIGHQAMFFRRSVFNELGVYREDIRITADYEFSIRAVFAGKKTRYMDLPIVRFDMSGLSQAQRDLAEKEKHDTLKQYLHPSILKDFEYVRSEIERLKKYEHWSTVLPKRGLFLNMAMVIKWALKNWSAGTDSRQHLREYEHDKQ